MAARLWPHAWGLLGLFVAAAFGLLEDAGFRRGKHKTLSRQTARIPHAALLIAVLGPVASWIYALHIARLESTEVSHGQ
jgi:hypothetical protein